jgi:hypothetical protein
MNSYCCTSKPKWVTLAVIFCIDSEISALGL